MGNVDNVNKVKIVKFKYIIVYCQMLMIFIKVEEIGLKVKMIIFGNRSIREILVIIWVFVFFDNIFYQFLVSVYM